MAGFDYECFVPNENDYEQDVNQFLQDGYYNSELGNTIPLVMASAFGNSLVILTSSSVFYISPRSSTTDIFLYLAYTSVGTGHYDGLFFK